jgi:two-component system, NtrC family, sensor histidine kinase KinB
MGWRDPRTRRLGLRPRFLIATALLVVTAVTASLWTLGALSRLSVAVGETLRQNDEATSATAQVATGLEREDDALLLVLAGDATARDKLEDERRNVDQRLEHLDAVLNAPPEQELVDGLRIEIANYRQAANAMAHESPGSLVRYHREVNPLLRRAVGFTARLRDRHFEETHRVASSAHDEVVRAQRVVLGISLAALVVSILLALQLARLVIVPLTEMTRGVRAIASQNFSQRLAVTSRDELGELASAFNDMAEHLTEFRRSNLGEVLQAKAALEATLQALPESVILLDDDRRVLSMNRRAQDLLGVAGSPDGLRARALEVGGVPLEALVPGEGPNSSPDAMDLAKALRVTLNGTERRLLARSLPVSDLSDAGQRTILVLYDVTELARLDEMRAELIAVASHELRTPLTTLRMTLLMLKENVTSLPPREQELVATCFAGVQQLGETIAEFLDLTRIEAGQMRLNVEAVDLRALLEQVAQRWAPRALEQEIELVVRPAEARVAGDVVRLRVVFDNLLSNALKYTPRGGQIRIDTTPVEPEVGHRSVRIAVVDTGSGVPAAYRSRIFEKFFRVEHHEPGGEVGTRGAGIGLYLCQQIVALHGGTIRCEASEGSRGTNISFEIPMRVDVPHSSRGVHGNTALV